VLDNGNYAGASGIDLSHAVTVFVTTVGAPTFSACLAHLRRQDCRFALHVIDHVAPMHAAFQRMLDECRTPYFVQVDEDMLLHPYAVRSLHERIDTAGAKVAMFAADLFDVHLQRCILGVKIFRHEIVRRYPFAAINAFESLQVSQFTADGYEVVRTHPGESPVDGQTLGLHGTQWTDQSIYERYLTLERRRRADTTRLRWFPPFAEKFLERFLAEPSEANFFALMGVVAGALACSNGELPAKDYRTYAELPGFQALRAFLADVQRGIGAGAVPTAARADDEERTNPPAV
jgi:hypothetical protein